MAADLSMEKLLTMQTHFKKWDKNGDGTLNFDEMAALLRSGNPGMTDGELRLLFSGIDANRDGRVDFMEFALYLHARGDDRLPADQVQVEVDVGARDCKIMASGTAREREGKGTWAWTSERSQEETFRYTPNDYVVFEHPPVAKFDGQGKTTAPKLNAWSLPFLDRPYTVVMRITLQPAASGMAWVWGDVDAEASAIGLHVDSPAVLTHFWGYRDLRATGLKLGDGKPHHIACAYDGRERSIYVDLKLVARDTPGVPNRTYLQHNLMMGYLDSKMFGENGLRLTGEIMHFRVFSCALSWESNNCVVCPRRNPEPPLNVAELPGESEETMDGHLKGVKENYVERPEHFIVPKGLVASIIEMRSLALVKGDYLIHLAETGQRLPSRAEAPADAFWPWHEAMALFRRSAKASLDKPHGNGHGYVGLFLIAISYSWCGGKEPHCDPNLFHLRRVAAILKTLKRLRQGMGITEDVGVFWDFISMFQDTPTSRKTPIQKRLHKFGMWGMNATYAHDLALVLKMKKMPPCPEPLDENGFWIDEFEGKKVKKGWEYDLRGWPCFEDIISDSRQSVRYSRLVFSDGEPEDLVTLGPARFMSQGTFAHPQRFAKLMEDRPCTNGSDKDFLVKRYTETFRSISMSRKQELVYLKWPKEMCERFSEALWALNDLGHLRIGPVCFGQAGRGIEKDCLRMITVPLSVKKLIVFSVICCGIKDDDLAIICENLPQTVEHFWLYGHCLTDVGIKTLATQLPKRAPNLNVLNVGGHESDASFKQSGDAPFKQVSKHAGEELRKALPRTNVQF